MRTVFSIVAAACLTLTTVMAAEAVTYPAISISVPASVDAPLPAGVTPAQVGTFVFSVTCGSPKTSTFAGIATTVNTNAAVANGRVTFGPAPVLVPMQPGLQSGATVSCALAINPNPGVAQQFLNGLIYDSSKLVTRIVLP